MTFGITPQGFTPKQVSDLLTDISTAHQANIDPQIDTSPETPLGQIDGTMADELAQLWELAALAYNALARSDAEGPQLDNVGELSGTGRKGVFPSFTLQTCVFSADATYATGALVANVSGQPAVQFANGENLAVQFVSGTTHQVVNTDTGQVIATGTLPITALGIKFLCTVNGPTFAPAGQLTVITTPVTGWVSTTNPKDAVPGALVEQDTPYRIRQEQELAAAGSGTVDAIRADVLQVPGVISCIVQENETDLVDANANPPHSYRVILWDGPGLSASNNDVAQAIWNDKPTGITPQGATTGTAVDIQGGSRTLHFDRATQLTLFLTYTVTLFPGLTLTTQSAAAMKTAIVEATQTAVVAGTTFTNPSFLDLGVEVFAEAMKSALLAAGLGVQNVTDLRLGFSASPSGTADLPVTQLQIAIADTSRILINGL